MSDVEVFGFSTTADGTKVAISTAVLVLFLVVAHYSLSSLDKVVSATAFRGAVQSLYKDLVVMGISSFILTMFSSGGLNLDSWLVYLQIADITLFISTFFHVLFAMCLIFANGYHMGELREQLSIEVHVLVRQFQEQKGRFQSWQPFNSLRSQMELRVLRITFLSKFNLSRSFDFGRYITIAEECNIIHMLEVSAAQWAMFLGILVPICIAFKYTPSDAYDSYMERRCSDYRDDVDMSTFNQCKSAWYQSLFFTGGCGLMFLFTVGLAMISRVYVLRLLRQSGCDINQMDLFLLDDEMADLENKNEDRISYKELKTAVSKLGLSEKSRSTSLQSMRSPYKSVKNQLSRALSRRANSIKEVNSISGKLSRALSEMKQGAYSTKQANSPTGEPEYQFRSNETTVSKADSPRNKVMDAPSVKMSGRDDESRMNSLRLNNRRNELMGAGIKSGIFLFDWPYLYYLLRDTSNLMLCLFFSFYVVTFSETAALTSDVMMWNILPVLFLLGAVGFQVYTIRSSSLIFSFYKLDPEILGRVIEEKEELQNIENLLREKLTNKIKHSTEQFNQTAEIALLQLFDEIQGMDGNNDGYITKHEFRALLHRLNIYFTKRRLDDAFGLIDTHADGMITLTEFHAFIFPADASKKRRQSRISKLALTGRVTMGEEVEAAPSRKSRRRSSLTSIHSVMSVTEHPIFSSKNIERSNMLKTSGRDKMDNEDESSTSEKPQRNNSLSLFLNNIFGSKHLSTCPESTSQRSIIDPGSGGMINRGKVELSTRSAGRYAYSGELDDSSSSDSSNDNSGTWERVYSFHKDASVGIAGTDDITKPLHLNISSRDRTESEGTINTFLSSQNSNSFFPSVKKLSPSAKASTKADISSGMSSKSISNDDESAALGENSSHVEEAKKDNDSDDADAMVVSDY